MNHKDLLCSLYFETYKYTPQHIEALPASGGQRCYYRLLGEHTVIGVVGNSRMENESFIYLSQHLLKKVYAYHVFLQ